MQKSHKIKLPEDSDSRDSQDGMLVHLDCKMWLFLTSIFHKLNAKSCELTWLLKEVLSDIFVKYKVTASVNNKWYLITEQNA